MKYRNDKRTVKRTIIELLIFGSIGILLFAPKDEHLNLAAYIIAIIFVTTGFVLETFLIDSRIRNKRNKTKEKTRDGEKIQGYAVDTFNHHYRTGKHNSGRTYGIKVLANNKIYVVRWLENNELYKKIERQLNNIKIENDIISFDKIPVDIYLKGNDYYVDIESIKI